MTDLAPAPPLERGPAILQAFGTFRGQLDAHTDKRERLIKLSRDITALSKKLIFLLHRLSTARTPAVPAPSAASVTVVDDASATVPTDASAAPVVDKYVEARAKELEIRALLKRVGEEFAGGEREAGEFWRYENNVQPGLEEYIEAISFGYFLEEGGLIPLQEVQRRLSDEETGKPFFIVTNSAYILGLSDLTGELMRYTLNAIGLGDHSKALTTLAFVHTMKAEFDPLTAHIPNLHKKQEVTGQSLAKLERAAYEVALRRQEFAGREEELGEMLRRRGLVEGGGDEGEGERQRKPQGKKEGAQEEKHGPKQKRMRTE